MLDHISLFVFAIGAPRYSLLNYTQAFVNILAAIKSSNFANMFHTRVTVPFLHCKCPRSLLSSRTFKKHGVDSIARQIAPSMGIDLRGSSLNVTSAKLIVSNLKPVHCEVNNVPMTNINAEVIDNAAQAKTNENWNLIAILLDDGSLHSLFGSYRGSRSLDA